MKYLLILMMLSSCSVLRHTDADLGFSEQGAPAQTDERSHETGRNILHALGMILQGAGRGMQNAPKPQTYHCTPDGVSGYNCGN